MVQHSTALSLLPWCPRKKIQSDPVKIEVQHDGLYAFSKTKFNDVENELKSVILTVTLVNSSSNFIPRERETLNPMMLSNEASPKRKRKQGE